MAMARVTLEMSLEMVLEKFYPFLELLPQLVLEEIE
jgi:hypothetical protein